MQPKDSGKSNKAQPFGQHLKELRQRLVYVVATLFLGCIAGYVMHERLLGLIKRPLHQPLYYTTPTGGFNAIIRVSILFGMIVTVPVLIYQVGKFMSPAFRRRIKAGRIILFSVSLGALGVSFAYFVSLPAALHFLANIGNKDLQPIFTINEYMSFVFGYIVGFAILFQLPLILLFINRIKPQRPGRLMRVQRYVILFSFILAAILTPTPDPMNQLLMALPIILLYQFSVAIIWFINRRDKPGLVEPATSEPAPVATPPTTYGTAPYPSAQTPRLAPLHAVQPLKPVPSQKPQLIMDIFWVPPKPAA